VSDLIDGVVIPKVESADQVERVAKIAPSAA
jgi:citrate lyase beta subunit